MKISIIVEYLNGRGGTARQALALGNELLQLGHKVQILALVWNKQACFPELTATLPIKAVIEIETDKTPSNWKQHLPVVCRKALAHIARITGLTYLIDYATMRSSATKLLALALEATKDSDVINPHDYGPAAWVAAELHKTRGTPVVWQCNDPFLRWDVPHPLAKPLRGLVLYADRCRVSGIRHITTLDTRVANAVQRRYKRQSSVVRSGVDLQSLESLPTKAEARRTLGVREDVCVSLVLALLNSPHRHVEDAIASHAVGPENVFLLLASPAPESELRGYPAQIASAISASPARERIIWLRRHLSGDNDLRNLFAASDVLVFPNVQQTWGLAVIEAAAAGLPVVISDGAGVSEVFQNRVSAMIYPAGDVVALAQQLAILWDNESRRQEIAERGRTMARSTFSWRKYALAMQQVFNEAHNHR